MSLRKFIECKYVPSILISNSIILLILTVRIIEIEKFPADTLYYFAQLPITYWAGLTLLGVYLIIRSYSQGSTTEDILYLFIFVLYLFGIPSFAYEAPRYVDTYVNLYGIISPVFDMEYNTIPLSKNPMYVSQFQTSTIYFGMLIFGLDLDAFLAIKLYPIFAMFIIGLLFYSLSKYIVNKFNLLIPTLYLVLSWNPADHLCAQSYALILMVLAIYLVIYVLTVKGSASYFVLLLISWTAICTSHALTAIFTLYGLIVIWVGRVAIHWLSDIKHFSLKSFHINYPRYMLIALGTILVGYIQSTSSFSINKIFHTITSIINNIIEREMMVISDRSVTTPSTSYLLTYNVRMGIILLTVAIGIIAVIYLYYNLKDGSSTYPKISVLALLFIGYSALGMFFVLTGYNVYGLDRIYMMLTTPLSLLIGMVLNTLSKHKLDCLIKNLCYCFLIICLIVFPVTKYSSEPYEFVSESEYYGNIFAMSQNIFVNAQESLTALIFYNPLAYTNIQYNWMELKKQEGDKYAKQFDQLKIHKIYENEQCQIYLE